LIAKRDHAWWGVGVCFGLGLLSKYSIGLLAVAVCLFMMLDAQSRCWWRRSHPYCAAALALALFSPVIVWNANHEWASFIFQGSRRLTEKYQFSLHILIASAIMLLTPTGVATASAMMLRHHAPLVAMGNKGDRQRAWRFLQACLGVPLAAFTAFSLFHETNLNWLGPPCIAAIPAMAFGIVHVGEAGEIRLMALIRAAWLPTLLAALLLDGLRFQYFTVGIPGLGYGQEPETIPVGWRELGKQIHSIVEGGTHDALIVGMDRYSLAGELAFYAPNSEAAARGTTSAHLFGQPGLMYESWFPPLDESGRTLLLVAWHAADLDTPQVRARVVTLTSTREGELRRRGQLIRPYYYRFAYGYGKLPKDTGSNSAR
jgi:dolichol-phosphate mannosyltransferase